MEEIQLVVLHEETHQVQQTKSFLDLNGIPYKVRKATKDELYDFIKSGLRTDPVVIASGARWSGYQPDMLRTLKDEDGSLNGAVEDFEGHDT